VVDVNIPEYVTPPQQPEVRKNIHSFFVENAKRVNPHFKQLLFCHKKGDLDQRLPYYARQERNAFENTHHSDKLDRLVLQNDRPRRKTSNRLRSIYGIIISSLSSLNPFPSVCFYLPQLLHRLRWLKERAYFVSDPFFFFLLCLDWKMLLYTDIV